MGRLRDRGFLAKERSLPSIEERLKGKFLRRADAC